MRACARVNVCLFVGTGGAGPSGPHPAYAAPDSKGPRLGRLRPARRPSGGAGFGRPECHRGRSVSRGVCFWVRFGYVATLGSAWSAPVLIKLQADLRCSSSSASRASNRQKLRLPRGWPQTELPFVARAVVMGPVKEVFYSKQQRSVVDFAFKRLRLRARALSSARGSVRLLVDAVPPDGLSAVKCRSVCFGANESRESGDDDLSDCKSSVRGPGVLFVLRVGGCGGSCRV